VRSRKYRWLWLLVFIATLVFLVMSLADRGGSAKDSVVISFLGYTNLPNNSTRFALFSLHNQDSLSCRWRGNWVELEGSQYNKAPTMNPTLPWFTGMTLKQGDKLIVAIGEPLEEGKWRFSVLHSRYKLKERLLDFAFKHKLPTGIGRFSIIDSQQILSPTNSITNSSPWLVK
jgi:hypothetical protein